MMNDRFKYRVKFEIDGKIEIFDVTNLDIEGGQVFFKRDDGQDYNIGIGCEGVKLIQCTGLKDKHGKLIYEGDILKGKKNMICSPHSSRMIDKVGVVEIPQNMFVATCRDVKNNCTLFCQNDWVKTEVIGNIYENSELLNEVENDT